MSKQLLLMAAVFCVAALSLLNFYLLTIPGTTSVSIGLFLVTVVLIGITHGIDAALKSTSPDGGSHG